MIKSMRKVNYLRLSVTDRCNLNCLYCDPRHKNKFYSQDDFLTYEEIVEIVKSFVVCGIDRIRLTGGEPLIRKDIALLIKMLKGIEGIKEIFLTTNGVYLKDYAWIIKQAGANSINISLNSLQKKKYELITGKDNLKEVLSGIEAVKKAEFKDIKLNVVLIAGVNDEEVVDFVKFSIENNLILRFIELYIPNQRLSFVKEQFIRNERIKDIIENYFGQLVAYFAVKGNGPGDYFQLKDSKAVIGFISNCSKNFCQYCSRIRMDSSGRIYPCLFSPAQGNLKKLLGRGKNKDSLAQEIKNVLALKSKFSKESILERFTEVSSIGG